MIYMTTCFGRNREHQCSSCCSRSSWRRRSSVRTCLCTQRLPDSTLCSLQDDRSGGLEKQENVAKDENLESFKLVLSLSLHVPCTFQIHSIVYTYPKDKLLQYHRSKFPVQHRGHHTYKMTALLSITQSHDTILSCSNLCSQL